MIIKRNLKDYLINYNLPVNEALNLLNEKKNRVLICIDELGVVFGSLSFGDINRWLLSQSLADLTVPVEKVMNTQPTYINENELPHVKQFSHLQLVPIVDDLKRVKKIAVFREKEKFLELRGKNFHEGNPLIIAEIGNNHNGSLSKAFELIDLAKDSGANCAKFQMRNMEEMYIHSNQAENLGAEYTLDLLERFQLSNDDLIKALIYTQKKGLEPLCTPWDEKSADLLDEFGVEAFKVASADFTNHHFLVHLMTKGKPLICSTGMCSEDEIIETIDLLKSNGAEFVLLHCNSTYPAPFKDVNLKYMQKLGIMGDCLFGYSGHERDINVSIAAVALGAVVIEKHFTLDKSLEGNDHKVSLLPNEFKNMVTAINQVTTSLGTNNFRHISQGEYINRVTLAKSIYAKRKLNSGQNIKEDDLVIKSPGKGLQPNKLKDLLLRPVKRNMKPGDAFYASDLVDENNNDLNFSLSSSWGIPVRHHDYMAMLEKFNPKILEFHLSYRDLDIDNCSFFKKDLKTALIVHAPELFFGDHTLDLTSEDPNYRSQSINELRRTIKTVKLLKKVFPNHKEKVGLITNVGGFSADRPLNNLEINNKTKILKDSLAMFNDEEVEILPQTMPPYPWHFGGQRYHNLFVEGDWIKNFCEETNLKVCLDVSHSFLACNKMNKSFNQFLDDVLPVTQHLHIADAKGVDGEGLQIHEGDIDFGLITKKMKNLCPNATWIPEIWQGHENEGYGFQIALNRLSKFDL